jgi:DNA-directed RNA polymerase specialized sigma subunit
MISFYLFIIFINFIKGFAYLTSKQWIKINSILTNPNYYTISQQQTIKKIIYDNYQIWASIQSKEFKKFYSYKCQHLSYEELKLYSLMGLHKAISCYKPERLKNITFSAYAIIYIRSELLKGITDLYPITSISKYERRKSLFSRKNKTNILIPNTSPIYQKICFNKYMLNKYNENKNHLSYDDLWIKINNDIHVTPIIKQIIKLKFSYEFKQIRSNKEISNIIGCSEETIRKYIVTFKNELKNSII